MAKATALVLLAAAVSTPVFVGTPTQATGDTRSLKIYYVHTGEKAVITYKRNGKFDPRGLEQLNRILRDWRKNQPTKMNPRLFDLIWEVYRESGSHEFINVICGFRSPDTNEMLRTRSAHTGVAKKSQHMLGNAMDFYIPDVKLTKLREIGMKLQDGGVGYYPTSGSPFVHMDVGGVRAWPRMDRQDLVRLFPDGKTMHVPADGKPLPGYQEAVADYKRRLASDDIQMASVSPKHRGFFAMLFGGGGGADEAEDTSDTESDSASPAKGTAVAVASNQGQSDDGDAAAPAAPAAATAPAAGVQVASAPIPQVRPAFGNVAGGSEVASALVSPTHGNAAEDALTAALPANGGQQQFADLSAYSVPVPSLLGARRSPGDAEVASANNDLKDGQLSGVPLPAERPAVAENLLASTDGDQDAQDDAADEGTLSPAIVAALEQRRSDEDVRSLIAAATAPAAPVPTAAANAPMSPVSSTPRMAAADQGATMPASAVQAINAAMPQQKTPTPVPAPVQMAALAPVQNASGLGRFADAFDVPVPAQAPDRAAPNVPVKGGRPGRHDADVASAGHVAVRTEPKLTGSMLSQWALANARVEVSNRPVKAPRFVSQTLRAQPSTVYTQGFKVQTASIDPGRFSGSAVNFMEVKKFNSVQ